MSRTEGHKKKQTQTDRKKRHKLKPFVADKDQGRGKFVSDTDEHNKITSNEKLITKNANRSKKKSARQQAKKEIDGMLDEEIE